MGDDFQVTYAYLLSIRKPLIAAINGACAGLGFCFALLCDMRFVEKTAKFTTAFSQRGLVAEHGVSWMLPRLIGPVAHSICCGARASSTASKRSSSAWRNGCAKPARRRPKRPRYIKQLAASAAPMSLMVMKQQVYRHLNMPLGDSMRDTNKLMAESLKRDDFREGVRSFMERRPPQFKPLKVKR